MPKRIRNVSVKFDVSEDAYDREYLFNRIIDRRQEGNLNSALSRTNVK